MQVKILNLGAGRRIIKGALNVDIVQMPGINRVWDLNSIPWPSEGERFNRVLAFAIIEHLRPNLVEVMDEVWRVTKPGGLCRIKVPYWKSPTAYNGIHVWQYNMHSFDVFDPATRLGRVYGYYTDRKWKRVGKVKLNEAKTSLHVRLRKVGR